MRSIITENYTKGCNLAKDVEKLSQNFLALNSQGTVSAPATLVELLCLRSLYQANQLAYTFLQDGETEEVNITYGELDRQARIIAGCLQSRGLTGQRALLLYPPGLEFITAFFGCLYAGVTAVPAYPPRPNRSMERLEAIVDDAQAKQVLTTTSVWQKLESSLVKQEKLPSVHWLTTDNLASHLEASWQPPMINQDTLAFLQYTSGSTGKPKGVMVSHGNLLHNERIIKMGMGHSEKTIFVGWLPLFHDMGLIGNVLQPFYLGIPCILMSPVQFLQKPIRWLQAISRYQATTSGGPNFAYDLCVRKITPQQLSGLDLSSWEVAFNGAEPIRAETMEKFSNYFAECGFRREAFYPCYGMAESTLFITGIHKQQLPVIQEVREADLQENRVVISEGESTGVRKLVGCGQAFLETEVKIVNPESKTECGAQEVGEIWVSGDSVAQGYWNQPELTEATFHAYTSDTKAGPFLRTGDLGFLQDGELYVTGRLKDLIIIRGRNHYSQDIELTVENSHQALAPNRSAAFAVEIDGEEKLVVLAEIERRYHKGLRQLSTPGSDRCQAGGRSNKEHIDPGFEVPTLKTPPDFNAVVAGIRQDITKNHGLQAYAILLLRIGSIPKTSSGKIRRYACRRDFLQGTLNVVGGETHLQEKLLSQPDLAA